MSNLPNTQEWGENGQKSFVGDWSWELGQWGWRHTPLYNMPSLFPSHILPNPAPAFGFYEVWACRGGCSWPTPIEPSSPGPTSK